MIELIGHVNTWILLSLGSFKRTHTGLVGAGWFLPRRKADEEWARRIDFYASFGREYKRKSRRQKKKKVKTREAERGKQELAI